MAFSGIPLAALDFYEGLEADNSKTFWTAHKATYDSEVKAPLVALGELLAADFGPLHIFRPYRDLRFGKDKTPYKDHQGAWFDDGGYVQVSAGGLFVGVGYYQMQSDQLARFRQAVDTPALVRELHRILDEIRAYGHNIGGEQLKTRPRDYPADHPEIELLRHKALTASRDFAAPEWLSTPEVVDHVRLALHQMRPLKLWLDDRVGESEQRGR